MLTQNISTNIVALLITILSLSSCSITPDEAKGIAQNRYKYPYQCKRSDDFITHFITAKVPLTANELKPLKTTLQEKFGLGYNSCVFVGDIKLINQQ